MALGISLINKKQKIYLFRAMKTMTLALRKRNDKTTTNKTTMNLKMNPAMNRMIETIAMTTRTMPCKAEWTKECQKVITRMLESMCSALTVTFGNMNLTRTMNCGAN